MAWLKGLRREEGRDPPGLTLRLATQCSSFPTRGQISFGTRSWGSMKGDRVHARILEQRNGHLVHFAFADQPEGLEYEAQTG